MPDLPPQPRSMSTRANSGPWDAIACSWAMPPTGRSSPPADGKPVDLVFTDPPYRLPTPVVPAAGLTIANDALERGNPCTRRRCAAPGPLRLGGACYVISRGPAAPRVPARHRRCRSDGPPDLGLGQGPPRAGPRRLPLPPRADPLWLARGRPAPSAPTEPGIVWEIPRPARSEHHPTMKPVELVERAIRNSSAPGEIVYDRFAAAGTMVAAERADGLASPSSSIPATRRWPSSAGRLHRRAQGGCRKSEQVVTHASRASRQAAARGSAAAGEPRPSSPIRERIEQLMLRASLAGHPTRANRSGSAQPDRHPERPGPLARGRHRASLGERGRRERLEAETPRRSRSPRRRPARRPSARHSTPAPTSASAISTLRSKPRSCLLVSGVCMNRSAPRSAGPGGGRSSHRPGRPPGRAP